MRMIYIAMLNGSYICQTS